MTNAEKFKEIFGNDLNIEEFFDCPDGGSCKQYNKFGCHCDEWLEKKYTGASLTGKEVEE